LRFDAPKELELLELEPTNVLSELELSDIAISEGLPEPSKILPRNFSLVCSFLVIVCLN